MHSYILVINDPKKQTDENSLFERAENVLPIDYVGDQITDPESVKDVLEYISYWCDVTKDDGEKSIATFKLRPRDISTLDKAPYIDIYEGRCTCELPVYDASENELYPSFFEFLCKKSIYLNRGWLNENEIFEISSIFDCHY